MSESYGKLPIHFEANRGQTDKDVRFLSRGAGYSLYLTASEAVLVLAKPDADAKRDARSVWINTVVALTPSRRTFALSTPSRRRPA